MTKQEMETIKELFMNNVKFEKATRGKEKEIIQLTAFVETISKETVSRINKMGFDVIGNIDNHEVLFQEKNILIDEEKEISYNELGKLDSITIMKI